MQAKFPANTTERVLMTVQSPIDAEKYGLTSWSLRDLQKMDDVFQNRPLAEGLRTVLKEAGVRKAYAPHVSAMSANIATVDQLVNRIPLGNDVWLYRNRYVPLDGIFLEPGMAFVMSGAGCPLIIGQSEKYVVVAHAGRDSLVDRGAVNGKPTRKHASVVEAIVGAFRLRDVMPHEIHMQIRYWIPAASFDHRFDDKTYGAYNWRLYGFLKEHWPDAIAAKHSTGVHIDLAQLFVEQARRCGVRHVWAIENDCLSHYPDLAHTRDGKDPLRRNLYVVKRNA